MMEEARGGEGLLEHPVRFPEPLLHVSPIVDYVFADDVVPTLLMHQRGAGFDRLSCVEDLRQFLVVNVDQPERLVRGG